MSHSPPAPPFEAQVSTPKQLGLIAIGIAMITILGLGGASASLGGVATALAVPLLGGVFLIPAILELRRAGPAVVIDERGIDDRRLGLGPIGWEAIERIGIASVNGVRMLELTRRDPAPLLARMTIYRHLVARMHQSLGYSHILVRFGGLTPGLDDAVRYLKDRCGIELSA